MVFFAKATMFLLCVRVVYNNFILVEQTAPEEEIFAQFFQFGSWLAKPNIARLLLFPMAKSFYPQLLTVRPAKKVFLKPPL